MENQTCKSCKRTGCFMIQQEEGEYWWVCKCGDEARQATINEVRDLL